MNNLMPQVAKLQPMLPAAIPKRKSNVFSATELLKLSQTKLPCLWGEFLSSQGLAALTGSSDVGKTSFLRQLSLAIVQKKSDFLGFPLNAKHGRVIYFATEDNPISTKISLTKGIDNNTSYKDLDGLIYIFNDENPLKSIENELNIAKTDLVIIDAYGDIFDGQGNDITSVRGFLNKYHKLTLKHDTAILFLHHNGKRTEAIAPNKNSIIGSQGFEGKMRLVMDLRKLEGSDKRYLHFTKGNNLSEKVKSKAIELSFDDNQQFHFIGNSSNINVTRKYDEEETAKIMSIAKPLKEKGISYDKILVELEKEKLVRIPSKGKLSELLGDSKIVQSH